MNDHYTADWEIDTVRDRIDVYLRIEPEAGPDEIADIDGVQGNEHAEELLRQRRIEGHYDRLDGLYESLGSFDDLRCAGNADFVGWYLRMNGSSDTVGDGTGRMHLLADDYSSHIKRSVDRVMYASQSYIDRDWKAGALTEYVRTDEGYEWLGEKPMPEYEDLEAVAPFADIDLEDEVKQNRPSGDFSREPVENALELYADAFSELAGGSEHVFLLDSVGGAYALIAPAATRPIGEYLSEEDRGLLWEDMMDRLNEWLGGVVESVNESVPGVRGTFEADLVNNKNRLYKAPMSVHSSLDGVVRPMDVDDPSYDYLSLKEVRRADVDAAEEWAAMYTDPVHETAVDDIVRSLWPVEYEDSEGWKEAVDERVAELKVQDETDSGGGVGGGSAGLTDYGSVPDDLEQTTDMDVMFAAVDDIDVRDVARQIIPGRKWDTGDRSDGLTRFGPTWRTSDSNQSCFCDSDNYTDLAEGNGGGNAVTLIARHEDLIGQSTETPEGEAFWVAVAHLRALGYDIPRFTGGDGLHPDQVGLFNPTLNEDERKAKAAALAMK